MSKSLFITLILTIIAVVSIVGITLYQSGRVDRSDLDNLSATVFRVPRIISPFELTDHTNKTFTQDSLKGNWSFIFFGYTNCPDVCPNTLSTMNVMATNLEKNQPDKVVPRFIMVSVDPERDTVEILSKYIPYFNNSFIGLTGTSSTQIDVITRQFGIPYFISKKSPDDAEYEVQHSGAILLVNPQGNLHALFSAPHDPAKLINEFNLIRYIHEQE
ncbi:MAG: SCO family protein [Sulfuriflexus sp.]|nr:SCO family protein [Sulfuriflexus sp.]